jgi:hypothetical protein
MYTNWMVRPVGSERETKRIEKVLRDNRIGWYCRDDGKTMIVNVGSTRRTTKRFDICKKLGFEWK